MVVIDGGRFALPSGRTFEGLAGGFVKKNIHGCLGETLLLAWDGRFENFSLGRTIPVERIEEIGRMGVKHGLGTKHLCSWGEVIPDHVWRRLRRYRRSAATPALPYGLKRAFEEGPRHAMQNHRACLNPFQADAYQHYGFERAIVRAEGAFLWDSAGKRYDDFVAGHGAVNVGHNAPRVLEAIRRFTEEQRASLLKSTPGVLSSALAANLAALAPGDLQMTFLCNSGAEAVEGALKTARAATGRSALAYTEGGYHGKTMGALSVSSRGAHRTPFEPLLSDCHSVPYGDLEALESLLSRHACAGFIVEPIQGEAGVIVPPDGYLREAAQLCKRHGTLLIVDEIQTGLGRTGALFAVAHEGVEPDILTLAKSLGGGVLPIGAFITRRDIWNRACGALDRFQAHTSTFGGNEISAAVAIATLETLLDERLSERSAQVGARLKAKLEAVQSRHPIITEVRGRGLMLGLMFDSSFASGWDRLIDHVRDHLNPTLDFFWPILTHSLQEQVKRLGADFNQFTKDSLPMLSGYLLSSHLIKEHGILTSLLSANSSVLRVTPPLMVSDEAIDRFVSAIDALCTAREAHMNGQPFGGAS